MFINSYLASYSKTITSWEMYITINPWSLQGSHLKHLIARSYTVQVILYSLCSNICIVIMINDTMNNVPWGFYTQAQSFTPQNEDAEYCFEKNIYCHSSRILSQILTNDEQCVLDTEIHLYFNRFRFCKNCTHILLIYLIFIQKSILPLQMRTSNMLKWNSSSQDMHLNTHSLFYLYGLLHLTSYL